MAFKLTMLSDVRSFLKGTADVEKSLDGVADSLDKLAVDTEADATKAANALETKFTSALKEVGTQATATGKKLGNDLHDGTRKAGQGMDDMKQEAHQTAREVAASFDGSAQSVAQMFQEVAANAFGGFGPAGAAAGLAIAAGLGIAKSVLDDIKTKADEAKQRIFGVADAVHDAKGNPELIDWAEKLRDTMKEIVDTKEWYEIWQATPVDRLTDMTSKVKEFGLTRSNIVKAMVGDGTALSKVDAEINSQIEEQNALYAASIDQMTGEGDPAYKANIASLLALKDNTHAKNKETLDGIQWEKDAAQATKDLADSQTTTTGTTANLTTGTEELTEAQKNAKGATEDFSSSLTDNLSVADEGLDKFVKKGKLNIDEWATELKRRSHENTRIKDFVVDVDTKLSPEALQNFEKLPTETQNEIAKAYKDGDKGDKKKIIRNLEAEAKVTSVKVDTSGIKETKVEIPVTVLATGVPKDVADASTAGQTEANKDGNKVTIKTKVDHDALQRQVNMAAASIHAPTIWVNVKTRKETP